jgi:putative lipoic acid-binding regulatory protein
MFKNLPGFRTRISELINKHNLDIKAETVVKKNKFGRQFNYVNNILTKKNTNNAIEIYKKLTQVKPKNNPN